VGRRSASPIGRLRRRPAARPAQVPDEIAHAALWLPPPVKPPQIVAGQANAAR
jgi:hypothetical protein